MKKVAFCLLPALAAVLPSMGQAEIFSSHSGLRIVSDLPSWIGRTHTTRPEEMNDEVRNFVEESEARMDRKREPLAYPSLVPVCSTQRDKAVMLGSNYPGYYMNQDCSKVFIIPPAFRQVKLTNYSKRTGLADCTTIKTRTERLEALIAKLDDERLRLDSTNPKHLAIIEALRADRTEFQRVLEGELKKYKEVAGLDVAINIDTTVPDDYLKKAMFDNQDLMATGTRFVLAPISHSYLSFVSPKGDQAGNHGILNVNAPGIRKRDDANVEGTASATVIANGAFPVSMTLNLDRSCPMEERVSKGATKEAAVAGAVEATLTYGIPVYTPFGFEAEVNFKSSSSGFKKLVETKDRFTMKQFREAVFEANDGALVDIKIFGIETGLDDKARDAYNTNATEEVRKLLAEELMNYIESQSNMFQLTEPVVQTPDSGTVAVQVGTRRSCSSSSAFGIRYRESCHDEPVFENRYFQGKGVGESSIDVNLAMHRKYKETHDSVLYRYMTSTFVFGSPEKEVDHDDQY